MIPSCVTITNLLDVAAIRYGAQLFGETCSDFVGRLIRESAVDHFCVGIDEQGVGTGQTTATIH